MARHRSPVNDVLVWRVSSRHTTNDELVHIGVEAIINHSSLAHRPKCLVGHAAKRTISDTNEVRAKGRGAFAQIAPSVLRIVIDNKMFEMRPIMVCLIGPLMVPMLTSLEPGRDWGLRAAIRGARGSGPFGVERLIRAPAAECPVCDRVRVLVRIYMHLERWARIAKIIDPIGLFCRVLRES